MAQTNNNSTKEQRKIEKEIKKHEKEVAALLSRNHFVLMLQEKQFVFMANSFTSTWDGGRVFSVTPYYNFLSVIGDTVVFQFAFDGYVGANGIGGFTMKGQLEEYRVNPGKSIKKPIRVNARVNARTHWGKPYFTLTVYGDGYANITFSIKAITFSMSGQVVKPEESGVYEGSQILIDR